MAPIPWVDMRDPLPDAREALREPDGLLAAGADLSATRLLQAYSRGIFPWFGEGQPVLWWSPDPRMVLFTAEFRLSRSLVKTLRRARREGWWRVTLDSAFERVIAACAQPRAGQDGTWIVDEMRAAYCDLARQGIAHSVEIWRDQHLVGGLYGVAIGRMFYGESMFTREPDASKAALAALVGLLRRLNFPVIDCQQQTGHLASLGARPIPRSEFLALVERLCGLPAPAWGAQEIELPSA